MSYHNHNNLTYLLKYFFILLSLIFSYNSFGLTTTSVCNGAWTEGNTWDSGVPGPNDQVVINHYILLDVAVYLSPSGHLIINSSGTLCGHNNFQGSFTTYGPMNVYNLSINNSSVNYGPVNTEGNATISGNWTMNGIVCIGCTFSCSSPVPCVPPTANFSFTGQTGCVNDNLLITNSSTYATTYQWFFPGGTPASSSNMNPIMFYSTPGTYYITLVATNQYGSDTIIKSIDIFSLPQVSAGNDTTICPGDTIILNGDADGSITWMPGYNISCTGCENPAVFPAITTAYQISVADSNGCSNKDSVNVYLSSVNADLGNDTVICATDSILLQVYQYDNITWSTGQYGNSITVNSPGLYWVSITDSIGCKAADSLAINTVAPPAIDLGSDTLICDSLYTLSPQTDANSFLWSTGDTSYSISISSTGIYSVIAGNNFCINTDSVYIQSGFFYLNLGNDTSSCDSSIILQSGLNSQMYLWSTADTSPEITVNSSGTYWLAVDNQYCIMRDTITVLFYPPVDIAINSDTSICDVPIVLTAGGSGTSFLWSTGETTQIIIASPSSATIYFVTATDDNGCTADANVTVTLNPKPGAFVTGNEIIFLGDSVTLAASGGNIYQWNNGMNSSLITVVPGETTEYCVTVMDTNISNCSDTACITINTENPPCGSIFIASVFSPNDDGINDMLMVRGKCIAELSLSIYDRWGNKVFETNDAGMGWDGTFHGKPLSAAVFVYFLRVVRNNGVIYADHGNITLIR